ncbi:cytochrome bd-type quinol oxidase, subunit 2 [Thiohalobacter thiocyanaticus]|uniref:Cytochrome bd-type quinol oxidase, subunit 2 n=1 Tax=Thiohalobacter thiocyanaticus TaxID=585455 RepID=A0A1Z4VQP5_9GAMM|nr:cytochrome bd-type quinol oxidase, subunit 2 [Thiohalobacter thiocyanaticus]
MTACDIYIGSLEDPGFAREGGDWNGNLPARKSPFFPPPKGAYNGAFHEWVATAGVSCTQVDFGGWVAVVNKKKILEFIAYCYACDPSYTDTSKALIWRNNAYLQDQLREIYDYVNRLDDNRQYALVASEF